MSKKRVQEYKECQKCKGEGIADRVHANGNTYPDYCEECKGSGRINI